MGGNGSHIPGQGVPEARRTHNEWPGRIDGHKILVPKDVPSHESLPMNSNSDSPIYLSSSVDKKTGVITVKKIAIYKNHKLEKVIDLNHGEPHMHRWDEDSKGDIGRKSHNPENKFDVPHEYKSLVDNVNNFNNEKHKWNEK